MARRSNSIGMSRTVGSSSFMSPQPCHQYLALPSIPPLAPVAVVVHAIKLPPFSLAFPAPAARPQEHHQRDQREEDEDDAGDSGCSEAEHGLGSNYGHEHPEFPLSDDSSMALNGCLY